MLRPVLASNVFSPTLATIDGTLPVPSNALEHVVFIGSRVFQSVATARYLNDPLTAHQLLAHYHHRTLLNPLSPLRAKAAVECAYHLTSGRLWSLLDQWIFSVSYITSCFELGVGYRALRELIRAYNAIDATTVSACPDRLVLLAKAKEYVYFARDHNVNLTLFPHMGHQIAITAPSDTFLHRDAKQHFAATDTQRTHFSAAAKSKTKTHREAITDVKFAPSGIRFATCSDDRSIKIFTASGDTLFTINHSASKIKRLMYSKTSRYLVAVAEDRTTFVFDATSSNLVSKFHGHNSLIRDVAISCRGRFVATAADDCHMKIWEAETGALAVSVPHHSFAPSTAIATGSVGFGVNCVVPDPFDEFVFYAACDKQIIGWRMDVARVKVTQLFAFKAHLSQPISTLIVSADGKFLLTCAGYPAYDANSKARVSEASAKVWHIGAQTTPSEDAGEASAPSITPKLVAELQLPSEAAAATDAQTTSPLSASSSPKLHSVAAPAGGVFLALSPDEQTVGVAMADGRVAVYRIDQLQRSGLEHIGSDPSNSQHVTLPPAAHFSCFAHHPVIHIQHLVFSHDSSMLAVTGNTRQIKVIDVGVRAGMSSLGDTSTRTVAEYLLEGPLLSIDWCPNPQPGAPEILIGDSAGRLHSLRLERPRLGL
eukprot:GILK01016809.1.p1 GENE.GILK01016809.1~~GILK01016809.1.p1  ORF type:complete len:654 (+),score=22.61 GILK01016809.1:1-1962(+)